MDQLEKFIKNNKEKFDVYIPSKKTEGKIIFRKPVNNNQMRLFLQKAAAILIIFSVSYVFHYFFPLDRMYSAFFDSENHIEKAYPELYKAKKFYTKQVSNKMEEMNEQIKSYPELKKEIQIEFNQLDSMYLTLKNDLNEDIDNKEVINAMINNYKLKLQILEDIIDRLQAIENKDTIQYFTQKESFEM